MYGWWHGLCIVTKTCIVMRKVKINVYGKVQGVGFRFLTMMLANELDITGSVQNKDDSSVYIEAIGSDQKVQTFISKIEKSLGRASRVDEVVVTDDEEIIDRNKFIIL